VPEVFFCTAPTTDERQRIADRCFEYWSGNPDADVVVVTPETVGCSLGQFQRERRIYADSRARHHEYICTDDDMLPTADDCLVKGIAALRTHTDFGILSAWPANCTINRWEPGEESMRCLVCLGVAKSRGCGNCGGAGWFSFTYQPFEDLSVMEHVSVGGLRFCRKGLLEEWPDYSGQGGYDGVHSLALRKAGYRVGYLQHARAVHLGEGKSTVWNTL